MSIYFRSYIQNANAAGCGFDVNVAINPQSAPELWPMTYRPLGQASMVAMGIKLGKVWYGITCTICSEAYEKRAAAARKREAKRKSNSAGASDSA